MAIRTCAVAAAGAALGVAVLVSPPAAASENDLVTNNFYSIVGGINPATSDGATVAPALERGTDAVPLECGEDSAVVPTFFFDLGVVPDPDPSVLWVKVASAQPASGSVVPVAFMTAEDPSADPQSLYQRSIPNTALAPIDAAGWSEGSWVQIDVSTALPQAGSSGYLSVALFPAKPGNPAELPYSQCGSFALGNPLLREPGDNSEPPQPTEFEPEEASEPFVVAKARGRSITARVGGDYAGMYRWRLVLQRKAGKWRTVAKKSVAPPKKAVFKNLAKGKYRVVLPKQSGFPAGKTRILRVK